LGIEFLLVQAFRKYDNMIVGSSEELESLMKAKEEKQSFNI
jgi:hypothetical protein